MGFADTKRLEASTPSFTSREQVLTASADRRKEEGDPEAAFSHTNLIGRAQQAQKTAKGIVSASAIASMRTRDEEITESSPAAHVSSRGLKGMEGGRAVPRTPGSARSFSERDRSEQDGGALGTMLLPFKLGVGGVVGSGKQWMSWISLDDHVRVIEYVIENDNIRARSTPSARIRH